MALTVTALGRFFTDAKDFSIHQLINVILMTTGEVGGSIIMPTFQKRTPTL